MTWLQLRMRHTGSAARLLLGLCCSFLATCAPAESTSDSDSDTDDAGSLFGDVGNGDGALHPDTGDTTVDDAGGSKDIPTGQTRLLLVGTLVTPAEHYAGELLIVGANIACAAPGTECEAKPEAAGAVRVETQGLILPGLIDMHNHILFDIFDGDDWLPQKSYSDHTEWPKEARYAAMLDVKQCLENASQGKPTWCPAPYNSKEGNVKCEMDKWGELKGLVAGTTSIVGLAGTTSACFGSVARTIDASQNGMGADKVQTSALFPPATDAADGVCKNFASGTTAAYLVHCGEGINGKAKNEFATLNTVTTTDGCLLAPGTVITHGTAFDQNEFKQMADTGVKLTWSPASNVALYGATTNVPAALDAGVLVSLGPDWSMGGSQNMLDELRFADAWDNAHWNNRLSPQDLLQMATVNAAKSLGLSDQLGQLKAGMLADIFVIDGDPTLPYDALLKATPAEVQLVLVGGQPLYGDAARQGLANNPQLCETTNMCGRSKFLCIALADSSNKLGQKASEIKAVLEQAMLDMDTATPTDGWNFAPLTQMAKCTAPTTP